jgi:hypothetical protein
VLGLREAALRAKRSPLETASAQPARFSGVSVDSLILKDSAVNSYGQF